MPKGPLGCWITKKSKSVLGGNPFTFTFRFSTGPIDWILASPLAFGTQSGTLFNAGERTRSKRNLLFPAAASLDWNATNANANRLMPSFIHGIKRLLFIFIEAMLLTS